jgi:prevent-host-death family protein
MFLNDPTTLHSVTWLNDLTGGSNRATGIPAYRKLKRAIGGLNTAVCRPEYNLTRVVRKKNSTNSSRAEVRRKDSRPGKGQEGRREWQLQEAKARFSEVFRLARESGPQRVTKHGREGVVVLSAEEYARLARSEARKGSLAEFFAASPLRGSGIDLDRSRDFGRDIRL